MSTTRSTRTAVAPAPGAPALDAEKLDCYRVALEFEAIASALAERCNAVLRDQLRRASLSVVLNTAEGAGQRARAQKRHLYSIARGSAMECAALVDVLRRRIGEQAECDRARTLLVRIIQMLTKLEQSLK